MNNPFLKYFTAEDHLQHQFITWLAYQYPGIKYHHSPDAGKRTPFEKAKYVYLGSDGGFPDLIFPSLLLAIELKIKPNKPTPKQQEWIEYLQSAGWTAKVCCTFQEATTVFLSALNEVIN